MAIYHMSAQVIGRSSGRSSIAAAAYRSGEKIIDERTGEIHDYTRKSGVDYKEILTPENCGDWAKDRAQLWNMTEFAEKRKDAQLAREINIAIPVELTPEQGRELVKEYAQENFVDKGMIADICIHGENTHNPHAHIMLSMREATPEGFGKKVREWNDKEQLEKWREEWAHTCNKSLERAGVNFTIDHRSFQAQGVDREPTIHQGPSATAIQGKGRYSHIAQINEDIAEYNRQIETISAAQKEIAEINRLLSEMQIDTPEEKAIEQPAEIVQKLPEVDKEKQQKKEQEDALLKEAGLYGKAAREANSKLHQAQEKLQSADIALFHAKQEQQKHNHEVDNMGFFKRSANAGSLNKRAEEIDKKIEKCTADFSRQKETVIQLEKAHSILEDRERKAREQQAQSLQGKADELARENRRAELLKQMEQKRERERERGRGR